MNAHVPTHTSTHYKNTMYTPTAQRKRPEVCHYAPKTTAITQSHMKVTFSDLVCWQSQLASCQWIWGTVTMEIVGMQDSKQRAYFNSEWSGREKLQS